MMEPILKTIIGPIVIGVVLRIVDKSKQGQIVSKRPQAYLDVSLGSFLAYDIDTILNSLLLSHSSHILSKVYILGLSFISKNNVHHAFICQQIEETCHQGNQPNGIYRNC